MLHATDTPSPPVPGLMAEGSGRGMGSFTFEVPQREAVKGMAGVVRGMVGVVERDSAAAVDRDLVAEGVRGMAGAAKGCTHHGINIRTQKYQPTAGLSDRLNGARDISKKVGCQQTKKASVERILRRNFRVLP